MKCYFCFPISSCDLIVQSAFLILTSICAHSRAHVGVSRAYVGVCTHVGECHARTWECAGMGARVQECAEKFDRRMGNIVHSSWANSRYDRILDARVEVLSYSITKLRKIEFPVPLPLLCTCDLQYRALLVVSAYVGSMVGGALLEHITYNQ